jgi:hypothetical protein
MVARFEPAGGQRATPLPVAEQGGLRVTLRAPVDGASLGYRVDGGPWKLYTEPFEAAPGAHVEAKAVRYGWRESDVLSLTVAAEAPGPM